MGRVPAGGAEALLAEIPTGDGHRLSCGSGAKGPRVSDWAAMRTNAPEPDRYERWLLIRRSASDPTEVAYFACGGPRTTTLNELVRAAGARWAIEDLFELAKGDCGLDEYEVRGGTGWHQHITLSLFALAVVAVIRSRVPKGAEADPADRARGAETVAPTGVGSRAGTRAGTGLVRMAPTTPAPRTTLPLPTARRQATKRTTSVGLGIEGDAGSVPSRLTVGKAPERFPQFPQNVPRHPQFLVISRAPSVGLQSSHDVRKCMVLKAFQSPERVFVGLLNRVPAILKRFRQAVLAAACSGRLTADGREKNPAPVTGVEWVRSVDAMRRTTDEGQKLRRLGEPTPKPIEEMPSCCTTRVGEITECLDHLRVPVKKEHRGTGTVPYYGANGRTGWTDQHHFDEDLVLVVEDESFIGRERSFSYVVRGKSWVNNHAHALRPLGGMSADYLNCLLAFYDFVPLTSGTTGRRKLNQAALLAAPLSIAPRAKQQEIARQVDKLFALADVIESRLADARRMADQFTQAVLAKAFRGELVPTEAELTRRENRTYKTATELLARIQSERESTTAAPKPARARKPKKADPA